MFFCVFKANKIQNGHCLNVQMKRAQNYDSKTYVNKLAKARKMRKPPGTLGLKNFGPGKIWEPKRNFCGQVQTRVPLLCFYSVFPI